MNAGKLRVAVWWMICSSLFIIGMTICFMNVSEEEGAAQFALFLFGVVTGISIITAIVEVLVDD